MRPYIQRVVFPRPTRPTQSFATTIFNAAIWPAVQPRLNAFRLPPRSSRRLLRVGPQDGWLQTAAAPPTFDATTMVAAAAQQGDWTLIGRRRAPLLRLQDWGWFAHTVLPTLMPAVTDQQRNWRIDRLRRPPLTRPQEGWWIAETFTPSIFWSAVASQQRAWATARRGGAFILRPPDALWAATLPVEFDVTLAVATAMAQTRQPQIARRASYALPHAPQAWITENIPPGGTYIPILRRRRR